MVNSECSQILTTKGHCYSSLHLTQCGFRHRSFDARALRRKHLGLDVILVSCGRTQLAPQLSMGKLGKAAAGGEGGAATGKGAEEWVDEQAALELYGE